ncbi:MAG: 4Fe-4S dicluster domain-containing protein [Butyribacter sp.]|nr:4Fe-4S dicluster domain-containing protein [bacterium]MDY3854861.1 4Fe-4S dicluster domain-containing protein [Butyribacter sp.]
MLNENNTIEDVKGEVLYQVAKAAFEGKLANIEATLPYEILPGNKPSYRCCVYKEREIIRERIMLAQNINPATGEPCHNTVKIIPAACENCPITRFTVTDNCQKCLGKKCMQACKFDAITMLRNKAYIDPEKCKECGQCYEACPYNAIVDIMRPCRRACPVDAIQIGDEGRVDIDDEKCIRCGACISSCPFGAISDSSRMLEVIDYLKSDRPVYALVAPAAEGQFGVDVTMESIRRAVKKLGFKDMVDVAIGADFVSDSESKEWAEAYNDGKKMTTSCCPAFVHLIRRHFPELEENISTTVSPMAATARLVKAMDKDAVCIFIGPCIAKKSEAGQDQEHPGDNADLVLTFEEFSAMLRAKNVKLEPCTLEEEQKGSVHAKRYANAGGVTKAVKQALMEQDVDAAVNVRQCNGAEECRKALLLMKVGKLPEDFIEGMICDGGCVAGPGNIQEEKAFKRERDKQLKNADDRLIGDTLKEYGQYEFSMHRRTKE